MTSPLNATRHWSSAAPFVSSIAGGNIVGSDDIIRCAAYQFYEDAYHNRPEAWAVTLRGEDDEEQVAITLPAAKKIIEATNRFLAVDFDFAVVPNTVPEPGETDPAAPPEPGDTTAAASPGVVALQAYINNLARREKLFSKFANQKRYGLIRGDAIWHITADDTKLPGQRISIHEVHPGQYFPIADLADPNRLAGCYLVDLVQDPREKEDKTKLAARVQEYRREQDSTGAFTGVVTSSLILYEVGKWDARNLKPGDIKQIQVIRPVTALDSRITQVPVYHVRNNSIPGVEFGTSEIAGIEVLMNALNQSMTDEDLTLVMQGLGMYWTNAAPPQNEDGSAGAWEIGPRAVIEVGDQQQFGRVTGVSSVAPFLEHMKYADEWIQGGAGVPDIAVGKVDVTVAESGISLKLQLAPIIAKNAEKELEMISELDHMFYDLCRMWLPVYEQIDFPESAIVTSVGDPMPENRQDTINELVGLVSNVPQIITMQTVHDRLRKFGYDFGPNSVADVLAESVAITQATQAAVDPYGGEGGGEDDGNADQPPVE